LLKSASCVQNFQFVTIDIIAPQVSVPYMSQVSSCMGPNLGNCTTLRTSKIKMGKCQRQKIS